MNLLKIIFKNKYINIKKSELKNNIIFVFVIYVKLEV